MSPSASPPPSGFLVETTVVASGSVADYTAAVQDDLVTEFAAFVGVDTSDVVLTVTGGSVNLIFTVFVPDEAEQTSLKEAVESKATEEFDSALSVTVEAAPIVAAVTTSPPPSPPPHAPPSPTPPPPSTPLSPPPAPPPALGAAAGAPTVPPPSLSSSPPPPSPTAPAPPPLTPIASLTETESNQETSGGGASGGGSDGGGEGTVLAVLIAVGVAVGLGVGLLLCCLVRARRKERGMRAAKLSANFLSLQRNSGSTPSLPLPLVSQPRAVFGARSCRAHSGASSTTATATVVTDARGELVSVDACPPMIRVLGAIGGDDGGDDGDTTERHWRSFGGSCDDAGRAIAAMMGPGDDGTAATEQEQQQQGGAASVSPQQQQQQHRRKFQPRASAATNVLLSKIAASKLPKPADEAPHASASAQDHPPSGEDAEEDDPPSSEVKQAALRQVQRDMQRDNAIHERI